MGSWVVVGNGIFKKFPEFLPFPEGEGLSGCGVTLAVTTVEGGTGLW